MDFICGMEESEEWKRMMMTGWGKNKEEESIREISRKFKALSTYNNYPLERNYPYTLLINMILQPSLWTLYLINLILISMIFPSQNTSHKVSTSLVPKEIAKWLNETKRMKRIVERKKGNKKSLSNKSKKKKHNKYVQNNVKTNKRKIWY